MNPGAFGDVQVDPHATSFLSEPEKTLDPALFDGTHLRPDVREWILDTVHDFLDEQFNRSRDWCRVWIAGSGVSYQWAAARTPGDLDILLGIDYLEFRKANPGHAAFSESEISGLLNQVMYDELFPEIAEVEF